MPNFSLRGSSKLSDVPMIFGNDTAITSATQIILGENMLFSMLENDLMKLTWLAWYT